MSAIVHFSIFPLDQGESLSSQVARAVNIIKSSGLDYRIGAMGTDIEGEFEQVMDVVRRCFDAMQKDCNRINLNIKVDYRKGRRQGMLSKIKAVGGG